jgi:hypothetical protein
VRIWGRSLAGIAGWNLAGGVGVVIIAFVQVENTAISRSLVLRSHTDCGVSPSVIIQ